MQPSAIQVYHMYYQRENLLHPPYDSHELFIKITESTNVYNIQLKCQFSALLVAFLSYVSPAKYVVKTAIVPNGRKIPFKKVNK